MGDVIDGGWGWCGQEGAVCQIWTTDSLVITGGWDFWKIGCFHGGLMLIYVFLYILDKQFC